MIAFLMFFYFFVFVSLFVAITKKKDVEVIYIVTKDLTHSFNEDGEIEKMEIDEDSTLNYELSDNDYSQSFKIELKTKIKDERILYEFHSYLSERGINEETIIMTTEDDNILWSLQYTSNVYEKFYDALIEYINENFLSENLVVYLNGENVETHPINLIK